MIRLEKINKDNINFVHQIFPGDTGKHWVNFNWYWAELSQRRPGIGAYLIYTGSDSSPVGFVAYGQHYKDRQLKEAESGSFELYHMVIDASKQRQGLGRLATIHVLQTMAQINDCEQLMVACHPDNKAAKALYKSFGFVEIGKNYDDDPLYSLKSQDAHVMGYPRIAVGRISSSRGGAEKWLLESIESEKDFNWASWEAGLVQ